VSVTVIIRRALDRFSTRGPGRQTLSSFSSGASYDPERVAFGPLFGLDDHLLGRGQGFDAHEHRDVVLVTWVVFGRLLHTDEAGGSALGAGELAVTHAGSGTTHSEVAGDVATRFVQMWLRPSGTGGDPVRETATPDLSGPGLVPVAGSEGLALDLPGATLAIADLGAGVTLRLPAAPLVHVFVVTGALLRSSLAQPLAAGDAFEITRDGGQEPDPGGLSVTAAVPTQLLVWTFAA
jgi:redox-sensitive bicupin YhaK (pirin superfamily)